jgi:hypothetical protein
MANVRALALGALPLALLAASVFTLDAREVAVVTSFGAPVRTLLEPGLYMRAPWPLHEVVRFDARARVLEVAPTELLTSDKKNLVVEAFAIWRVADPQKFLEAAGGVAAARANPDALRPRHGASSPTVVILGAFLAAGFFAADFLAADFLAADFLAAGFFAPLPLPSPSSASPSSPPAAARSGNHRSSMSATMCAWFALEIVKWLCWRYWSFCFR